MTITLKIFCNFKRKSELTFCVLCSYADGYSAVTAVQLRVQPAITDRPRFSSATYVTYLHVNMSVGDFVVAVATTGAPRNHGDRATYHITAGNEGSVFTIEPYTGLRLLLLRCV